MRWDIFCRVIDNHGDIGVCWRLAADLATRGEAVRLWVDDASALQWMAPAGQRGVEVRPWAEPLDPAALAHLAPGDVLVEAFGCEVPPEFVVFNDGGRPAGERPYAWLNLEYLSAEPWAERTHRLPSPVMSGPGRGRSKTFFYPGFTPGTGGLLREPDLMARRAAFDAAAWRARVLPGGVPARAERLVSLFCYEPAALPGWLDQLARGPAPTRLLVTPGRAQAAVRAAQAAGAGRAGGTLAVTALPAFPQPGYDELLWACDLNFVRGEDSLVRALWAGQPFVWQIYPQHDNAHHDKLDAFLGWLGAPASLRAFHHTWNGLTGGPLPAPDLPGWGDAVRAARERLLAQPDLATQLLGFVTGNR